MSKINNRRNKAIRTCILGVILNAILFVFKLLIGLVSRSISILSDSFNNLSDMASGILNLFGFYISSKPADKKHPFGHGRIEYIVALIISSMIIVVGVEFLRTSIDRIINPEKIIFAGYMIVLLSVSVVVKLFLFFYYRKRSKTVKSKSLAAAAVDSLSDAVITLVAMISLLVSALTEYTIDGYVGAAVSLAVIYAGYSVAKESISPILGRRADPYIVDGIRKAAVSEPEVFDVHDIIVHDYGPERFLASAHIEIDSSMSLIHAHKIADSLEKKVLDNMNIPITIHIDPVLRGDPFSDRILSVVSEELKKISEDMSIHDFRITQKKFQVWVEFDIEMISDFGMDNQMILARLQSRVNEEFDDSIVLDAHFDRTFFSACDE